MCVPKQLAIIRGSFKYLSFYLGYKSLAKGTNINKVIIQMIKLTTV